MMKEKEPSAKVRMVGPEWFGRRFERKLVEGVLFSFQVPLSDADGFIACFDPSPELLEFEGPKLWFSNEPSWHAHYHRDPVGKQVTRHLDLTERAWHSHPHEPFRVPHPTHWNVHPVHNDKRLERAVALVSNFGGSTWFLKKHFRFRNRFILDKSVDLYGHPQSWEQFRSPSNPLRRKAPPNYRGGVKLIENSSVSSTLKLMAEYKVAVCLENSVEGYYFTEKFVNACRSGCIPVYHASEAIKETFLEGARWVDPKDFDDNPEKVLRYAIAQDIREYQEANTRWLNENQRLQETSYFAVFDRICRIMLEKIRQS